MRAGFIGCQHDRLAEKPHLSMRLFLFLILLVWIHLFSSISLRLVMLFICPVRSFVGVGDIG